jgi:predicted acylesterase/phospholipase RssA
VTNFDVYVGTSAGAFIAALSANGVTPEEMMRVVTRQGKPPFKDINIGDLLRPNLLEFARKGAMAPLHIASQLRHLIAQPGGMSLMDVLLGLADFLPSGMYTGSGIERYMHDVLTEAGRTDTFSELDCELYLTATDLDTCERVVFGVDDSSGVPISTAVRASGALPMVYAPVRVNDRELIDGGIVSTTNLDIAIQAGAKLVVVINPIVPFINDFSGTVNTLRGPRPRRITDMGLAQIGYQTFKLVAHQRLHELAKGWEARYPGVDIVLIEPEPTDELMFQTSMMSFTSRVEIARHGFESVTKQLAGEIDRYQDIAQRHGLDISAKRVRQVVEHFDKQNETHSAWRKILEGTTGALLRQSGTEG